MTTDPDFDFKKNIDWTRELPRRSWDPSRKLIKSIRSYQYYKGKNSIFSKILLKWAVLRHRFWTVVTASDIPINCNIGGGVMLTHPNGVVIHPDAEIGINCLILQQVTIVSGVRIGNYVDLCAGAKIVKPVRIADGATVGANSVVLDSVDEDATVVGVPARNILS